MAFAVRGTVAGHRLGALEGHGGVPPPPFQCIPRGNASPVGEGGVPPLWIDGELGQPLPSAPQGPPTGLYPPDVASQPLFQPPPTAGPPTGLYPPDVALQPLFNRRPSNRFVPARRCLATAFPTAANRRPSNRFVPARRCLATAFPTTAKRLCSRS